MNRQVDIKALVSHIVRGDGADRCRICMGDTTDGKVFLGDTVLLDGERAVTLAELLQTLTGVEVYLDGDLPAHLCSTCATSAIDAATFRTLCVEASKRWMTTLDLLHVLANTQIVSDDSKRVFAIIQDDKLTVTNDCSGRFQREQKQEIQKKMRQRESKKSKKFKCPDCGKRFLYPHHLHLHLSEAADNKRACQYCASVMDRDDLIQHLVKVHCKEPYVCKDCPAIFSNFSMFIRHIGKAHAPGAFACGDCGRSYASIQAYSAHLSVHTPKTCPGCNTTYRNQQCFSYHVRKCCNINVSDNRDGDKLLYRSRANRVINKIGPRGGMGMKECYCDYCGKKFSGKKYIKAHIQIVHSTATHKNCVYCNKYLAAARMSEHLKKHELVRMYTCNYCGVVLKSDLGMKQHLRLHTGEKPYECHLCGESFSASSRRSEHVRKSHLKVANLRHACTMCKSKFKLPYQLRRHVATVHSATNPSNVKFECDLCDEKFASCRGLINHNRKH